MRPNPRCEPGFGAAASHVCRESGRFEGGVCAPCPYGEWGEFGHCSACNECAANGLLSAKHGKCTSTLGPFCIDPDAAWVLSTYYPHSLIVPELSAPPRPGRSSDLRVSHSKSILDGGSLWACGRL